MDVGGSNMKKLILGDLSLWFTYFVDSDEGVDDPNPKTDAPIKNNEQAATSFYFSQ